MDRSGRSNKHSPIRSDQEWLRSAILSERSEQSDRAPRTLWLVADQTSASIDIAAKPDEVMAVIANFEHYPDWVDSMKSAEVLTWLAGKAKTVSMVLDHTLVKDNYVLAYEWKPQAVSWKLIEGTLLKAIDGSYLLKANGAKTTVTYTLTVDINMPMIGMFKRKAGEDDHRQRT